MKKENNNYDSILANLHAKGIIPSVLNRIFLFGPPGTGKSTIASVLFGREKIERVAMSGKTPIEDILGMMTLNSDGKIVWIDGPATKALREGKILVIDEIDQTSPAMRCTLHALLDRPAGITLPSGERVEAAPGYCVIATSNESPAALAPALLDRFEIVLPCLAASQGLRDQLGAIGQKVLDNVNERAISDNTDKFNWKRPITPRFLLAVEALLKQGFDVQKIAEYLFPDSKESQTDFLCLYS